MLKDEVVGAMKLAQEGAKEASALVREALGANRKTTRVLAPQEQLQRFMNMTPDQLQRLEARHGREAFNRYLTRMRQLAEEVKL